MTKDKIKLVNQSLAVDTNAMMMLRDLATADHSKVYQNLKPANQSSLTPLDGIKIYLKAISRLGELLEESKNSMDLFNKKKNVSNPKIKEESKKHHYELTLSVAKMRDIVEEFIQGFAVVHDMDAKDFMTLLYYRFHFIQEKVELFYLTSKVTYVDDIKLVLGRLQSTFKKMVDVLEQKPAKNDN
jgi:hypothetical protein